MKKNRSREKCQKPFPLRYSRKLISLVQRFCAERTGKIPGSRGFWQEFAPWANSGGAGPRIGVLGRRYAADPRTWSYRYTGAKHYLSPEGRRQQAKLDVLSAHLIESNVPRREFYDTLSAYIGIHKASIQRCLDNRILWPAGLEDAIVELTGLDLKQYDKKPAPPPPDAEIPDEDDLPAHVDDPAAGQTGAELAVTIVRRLAASGKIVTPQQAQVIGGLINGKALIDIVVEQM